MPSVHVVTDSTADIPPQLVTELDITVLPCIISFGNEAHRDGVELTNAEFYDKLADSPILPTTAHPPLGLFLETYERLCRGGDAVFSIHISEQLSGTMRTAETAAAAFPERPIRVMDSRQLSMGLGWQAVVAARAAQRGLGLDEIYDKMTEVTKRARAMAALQSLWHVQRGGRIGKATALLGTTLRMKPLVEVVGGEVLPIENVRTWHKALERLAKHIVAAGPCQELAILNANDPQSGEILVDLLADYFPRERTLMGESGATITTHLGLGAVGICCLLAE
ncbi:MAG: DegV family protein [Chloroflexota bacterium]|nr:DegV family protein [Chloroflexota bacterium]